MVLEGLLTRVMMMVVMMIQRPPPTISQGRGIFDDPADKHTHKHRHSIFPFFDRPRMH